MAICTTTFFEDIPWAGLLLLRRAESSGPSGAFKLALALMSKGFFSADSGRSFATEN